MILVVGSTGLLGGEVCQLLACKGIPSRRPYRPSLLGRSPQWDPGRHLHCFCTKVFYPGGKRLLEVDLDGIEHLVDEATTAGVSRFIFTSFASSVKLRSPLLRAKRSVEKYLRESKLVYTIVRSSFFMETWFSPSTGFDPEQARATIFGDGLRPIRWISVKNVAQVIVAILYNRAIFDC